MTVKEPTEQKRKSAIVSLFKPSIGCVATIVCALNLSASILSLYRLMNPLSQYGDLSILPNAQLVSPKWNVVRGGDDDDGIKADVIDMRAYLSVKSNIGMDDLVEAHGYEHYQVFGPEFREVIEKKEGDDEDVEIIKKKVPIHLKEPKTILLFDGRSGGEALRPLDENEDFVKGIALHLTSSSANEDDVCMEVDGECSAVSNMFMKPSSSLGQGDGSLLDGSLLIAGYEYMRILMFGEDDNETKKEVFRKIQVEDKGPTWNALMNNRTVYVHVMLSNRDNDEPDLYDVYSSDFKHSDKRKSINALKKELTELSKMNSIILGKVGMIKQTPIVKKKPSRILYHDLIYLYEKHVLGKSVGIAPWIHNDDGKMESTDIITPHWKPEVAVKIVPDESIYPFELANNLGMSMVQGWSKEGATYFYLPGLHVDEIGLTSEMYIPLNSTVTSLPLKLSFGDLSPQRWRLISHFGAILEQSRTDPESAGLLGQVEESDIDDIRSLIADTNISLLLFTLMMSTLHLLFEFLAFKSDVDFWKDKTSADGTKKKKRLAGLSIRSLFIDLVCQIIIFLYLIDQESTLLMVGPQVVSVLIAGWKCQKAVSRVKLMNKEKSEVDTELDKLDKLTLEIDRKATTMLGILFSPILLSISIRSLIVDQHYSWYSWFISTASGSVYTFGFILMTPQLFLNYKLKSVAHLPWRVLGYKFINTFIDDLFVFIIRMPTMARISAFRDDIVFVIYVFQRFVYPVDENRPAEGIGGDEDKN